MVLSNKKLKQKLRSLVAESLSNRDGEVSGELKSFKEAMADKKRPKPKPKTKVRTKKVESLGSEEGIGVFGSLENGDKSEDLEKKGEKSEDLKEKGEKSDDDLGDLEKKEEECEGLESGELEKKGKKKKKKGEGLGVVKRKKGKNYKKNKKMRERKKREGMEGKKKDGKEEEKEAESEVNLEEKAVVGVENEVNLVEPLKLEETTTITTNTPLIANLSEEREEPSDVSRKVFVGGIPYYSSEDDIRSFFYSCGTITEMDCMTFPESGKFRGIAILTFKTEAAAKRALALDGADMGGLYLKIQPYKSTKSAPKSDGVDFAPEIVEGYNRIYAGNLAWDITEDDLRKILSGCKISSIRFGEDKETGEFKGYAHVDFSDNASLAIALKLDQTTVRGRPVKIRCAVPLGKEKGAKVTQKDKLPNGMRKENAVNVPEKNDNRTTDTPDGTNFSWEYEKEAKELDSTPHFGTTEVVSNSGIKKKRRTCYECGVPGHLSSECPQKKSADTYGKGEKAIPGKKDFHQEDENEAILDSKPQVKSSEVTSNGGTIKKKRRTCYECGVPGHLSSECPNKKDASAVEKSVSAITNMRNQFQKDEIQKEVVSNPNTKSYSLETPSSDKVKKKRRTCYECGVPGHLSSECPQKKTAGAVGS